MRVDYIWRYDPSRYSSFDIELAVEHETAEKRVDELVKREIQHLVDLKARNKIGIFYPHEGDEEELIEKIQRSIKSQSIRSPLEKYLIILGYTTKLGKKLSCSRVSFLTKKETWSTKRTIQFPKLEY